MPPPLRFALLLLLHEEAWITLHCKHRGPNASGIAGQVWQSGQLGSTPLLEANPRLAPIAGPHSIPDSF
jgi:hypothetical protein